MQDAAGRPIPVLPRRSTSGFSIIANAPVAAFTPTVQTDMEVERLCLAHLASTAKDASVVVTEVDTAGSDAAEQDILIGETCLVVHLQASVFLQCSWQAFQPPQEMRNCLHRWMVAGGYAADVSAKGVHVTQTGTQLAKDPGDMAILGARENEGSLWRIALWIMLI